MFQLSRLNHKYRFMFIVQRAHCSTVLAVTADVSEQWARHACDVSVLDVGLGQRQRQRLGTAALRGVVA